MKIKKAIKYMAIGLIYGSIIAAAIYFLGSFAECGYLLWDCFCSCGENMNSVRKTAFGDFWSWNCFFNYLAYICIGCGVIGYIYGYFSSSNEEADVGVPTAVISIFVMIGVYLLTLFSMWCATN